MTSPIYLDNATVLPPRESVLKAMWPFYEYQWGNFSSPHDKGQELNFAITRSYEAIQNALQLSSQASVIITSSGAEASTQAIHSALRHGTYELGKNHIAVARFHDAAVTLAAEAFQKDNLATVTYIQANRQGAITVDAVIDVINPRTCLVAFPLVHPLTGIVQPFEEILELCQKRSIPLLVDISQSLGTVMTDIFSSQNCYFTVRGEALGIPHGVGALIATSSSLPLSPVIYGDEHPSLMRGGALHVAGLSAFAEAIEAIRRCDILYCTEVCRMKDLFEERLREIIGSENIHIPFSESDTKAPHISCVVFKGVKNEALLYLLNKKKVYATIGGGGFQNIVDVLEGMGLPSRDAFSAISFCFSDMTKEQEVLEAVDRIAACYNLLRRVSPE